MNIGNTTRSMTAAFLGGLSVLAISNTPALAQQTAQAAAGLEEIVVTARRREENLQAIPVAVRAFSDDELREKGVLSAQGISTLTPAYVINSHQGRESVQIPRLRGLPNVRTYFAEVPASIAGLGGFYDLQNVQVLLGPQGTLFGLNSLGGAVLREPKRPTMNVFEGYVEGTLGNYNQRKIEGAVNIPVLQDKVAVRLATERETRDGFTKSLSNDLKFDDRDYWAYRGSITVKPWDGIENYLVYDGRKSSSNGPSYFLKASNPRAFAALLTQGGQARIQQLIDQQAALGRFTMVGGNVANPYDKLKSGLVVDILTAELSDQFTFKNIASRGFGKQVQNFDEDGVPLALLDIRAESTRLEPATVTWTEEPQLQAKLLDGKFTGVLGAYYSYTEIPNPRSVCNAIVSFGAVPNCTTRDDKSRTQAIYTQGTLDLSLLSDALDGLKFTAGYRYNWDFVSQWQRQVSATTGACTNAAADRNCVAQQNASWKAPGWTFALDYQVLPQTLLYATARRAYTSGALNPINVAQPLRIVQPQTNTDVEVGVKSDFDIGTMRMRTNAAFFRNWFKNVIEATTAVFNDATGVQRSVGVSLNAAKATILGGDFQVQLIPTDWLEISGNYQYLMAKYNSFKTVNPVTLQPVDISSRGYPFAPRHTGNLTVKMFLPIEESMGRLSIAATAMRMSETKGVPDGAPFIGATRKQLDLRADWSDVAGYPIDVSLFMTNVLQNEYNIASFNTYQSLGLVEWVYNEPRAYGFSVRYRFGN